MKRIFIYSLLSIVLLSCHDNLELDDTIDSNQFSYTHTISIDEALRNLENFMLDFDSNNTKSSNTRKVKSISPIINTSPKTRSNIDSSYNEPIVYIANFEDNQGYAILSADSRIDEPVLAVTDYGYMDDGTIYSALDLLN